MDKKEVKKAITAILKAIGEDPKREGLRETPDRVVKAYEALFSGYGQNPRKMLTTFTVDGYDEMVVMKGIEFYSVCEHHLLPFFGKVHVGYIPKKKVVGLSKIPRVIEVFTRRLQIQERLAHEIGKCLYETLSPHGVGVVIEAQHLCLMARGVEKQNSAITTSALFGTFKSRSETRSEFLRLINGK